MMTKLEQQTLKVLANSLKQLASLERANFSMNEEKDKEIKKAIKSYMTWFEGIAYDLEKVVELSEDKGFIKKDELENIIRRSL